MMVSRCKDLSFFWGVPEAKIHGGPIMLTLMIPFKLLGWALRRLCKGILSFEVSLVMDGAGSIWVAKGAVGLSPRIYLFW